MTSRRPSSGRLLRPAAGRLLRGAALAGLALAAAPALHAAGSADTVQGDAPKKDGEDKPKTEATADDYTLDTSGSSTEIKVATDGRFSVAIKPKEGFKVHPQAPLEVKLKASAGVRPAKKKLGRSDVVNEDKESTSPEVATGVTGQTAGAQTIDAELSFFLCSETFCQRMKDKVTVPVTVKD